MQDFRISPYYTGPRMIVVPVKMYSKNSFLNALGVQSRRWLGINLDRFTFSFHRTRTGMDPHNELFFWQIRAVDADMSRSYANKYYLNIQTLDKAYNFKFRNVNDFFTVVEALRHTLRNNQPFYVSREDYAKLAALQQRTHMINTGSLHASTTAFDDISSDEEYESYQKSQLGQRMITSPTPYSKTTKQSMTTTTMGQAPMQAPMQMPVASTLTTSQIMTGPGAAPMMTDEEYQYLKWKNMDRQPQNVGMMDTYQTMQAPPSPPMVIETKTSRVEEEYVAPMSAPMSPGSPLPRVITSPVGSQVDLLNGSGLSASQKVVTTTTSTVVPPPPALSPHHDFNVQDWRQMELQMAEEERELAIKQEELRQREAILRLQKLNIKRAELEARREALRDKEMELHSVEYEIKGIQTEIGHIKNGQVLERLNSQDHRDLVEKSKILLTPPIVTQVPGEIIEVATKETKTITEETLSPRVDVFTSFANNSNAGYNSAFQRY